MLAIYSLVLWHSLVSGYTLKTPTTNQNQKPNQNQKELILRFPGAISYQECSGWRLHIFAYLAHKLEPILAFPSAGLVNTVSPAVNLYMQFIYAAPENSFPMNNLRPQSLPM